VKGSNRANAMPARPQTGRSLPRSLVSRQWSPPFVEPLKRSTSPSVTRGFPVFRAQTIFLPDGEKLTPQMRTSRSIRTRRPVPMSMAEKRAPDDDSQLSRVRRPCEAGTERATRDHPLTRHQAERCGVGSPNRGTQPNDRPARCRDSFRALTAAGSSHRGPRSRSSLFPHKHRELSRTGRSRRRGAPASSSLLRSAETVPTSARHAERRPRPEVASLRRAQFPRPRPGRVALGLTPSESCRKVAPSHCGRSKVVVIRACGSRRPTRSR
jgi:hypothetical protein